MLSPRGQWPRGQNFSLGFGLGLKHFVVLLCNRAFFGQKSCKIREFCNFFGNNLKSYVVNRYFVIFHNYFWPRAWLQPPEIDLDLGLGLEVLPLLTSLRICFVLSFCLFFSCLFMLVGSWYFNLRWSCSFDYYRPFVQPATVSETECFILYIRYYEANKLSVFFKPP